jgi:hypothetical protein
MAGGLKPSAGWKPALLGAGFGGFLFRFRFGLFARAPLLEEQAPQGAQIVEDAAAGPHVGGELAEVVGNQLEGLEPALRLGLGALELDLSPGFFDGLAEQLNKLLSAFEILEWVLRRVGHGFPNYSPPRAKRGITECAVD